MRNERQMILCYVGEGEVGVGWNWVDMTIYYTDNYTYCSVTLLNLLYYYTYCTIRGPGTDMK